jgi:hypothetical protein
MASSAPAMPTADPTRSSHPVAVLGAAIEPSSLAPINLVSVKIGGWRDLVND